MKTSCVIEIRPRRHGGWQCNEAPGVGPFFVDREAYRQAIDYATGRMRGRTGEIRVYNAAGDLEQTLRFTEPLEQAH